MVLNRPIIYLHGLGAASLPTVFVSTCTCFSVTHSKLNLYLMGGLDVLIFQVYGRIQDFHNKTAKFNIHHEGYSFNKGFFSF